MAALSNYLEDAVLNATLRNQPYTSPATVYLALFTSAPTDAGTGSEVGGGGYARQAVAFDAPSGGACVNSADVSFTNMPSVTVSHVGIYDALTGGNLLYHGPLAASKTVASGDTFLVRQGDLTITLD